MKVEIGVETNQVYCWIDVRFGLDTVGLEVLHIRLSKVMEFGGSSGWK